MFSITAFTQVLFEYFSFFKKVWVLARPGAVDEVIPMNVLWRRTQGPVSQVQQRPVGTKHVLGKYYPSPIHQPKAPSKLMMQLWDGLTRQGWDD